MKTAIKNTSNEVADNSKREKLQNKINRWCLRLDKAIMKTKKIEAKISKINTKLRHVDEDKSTVK